KVLEKQCESAQVAPSAAYNFADLLKHLNAKEKLLLCKYFCQLPLNVGSFRMLRQLQSLRILTATEYVCSVENEEQLQLILIEFLESEPELLSNLFVSALYNPRNAVRLNDVLETALRNLYGALAENPKLSSLKYVEPLCKSLPGVCVCSAAWTLLCFCSVPAEVLVNVCMQMHLSILLELHESEDVSQAFQHFSAWINEGVDELGFIKCLTSKLFGAHHQEALNYLFKLSTTAHFKHWKFYLILMQSIASSAVAETTTFIKKYLKNRVQHVASLGCQLSLLHLLLTARAAAASTMNIQQNLDNYAQWYKQNIGEMSYALSTEQFQVVLNMLEDSVHYEMEIDYLEIHAAIAISPGGKLVQAYKSKCKAHLARLKAASRQK
ncbi:hypothetical protein KR222_000298, partial [Zaprionus bogoriensis]